MHRQRNLPAAFAELGVDLPRLRALQKIGFVEPSEIQRQLIPLILQGRDVMGQARTGTGKTAAFGLPILQSIELEKRLQALILVPTRELAVQVAAELRRMCDADEIRIVPIYGGQKIKHQLHLLGRRPHICVGTPGRVMDLMGRGALSFDEIRFVVLDEVDRMLDIGFRDDIRYILSYVKTPHQTIFVSATLDDEIKHLAAQYMNDPLEVNVSRDELTVEEVTQVYMTVDPWDKYRLLTLILEKEDPRLAIIFCNTKHGARKLAKRLHADGVSAREIHGDLVQAKRERVMDKFRKHHIKLLIATDLAARGIDVQGISHIINYDMPDDPHVYVHRIGRTARMGSFGKAISLVTREQGAQLTAVEQLINKEIPQERIEGFVSRPPPGDFYGRGFSTCEAGAAPEPVTAAPATATPARPKTLAARFKPARRRRR
ncbi:MAG TPA: DEAD/DEAH box helicase [Phycisphaerae bacterium]|nr:DEAD/DEAH box helicase [Phycisphaerae bacterium]HOJ54171.1 DEAD/DEAH box helicase [Phycisphaerae bacterium]HOL26638.1 DEAD/DEAH box helicase [Phycisphaerae bacterium]HPP20372.1 DEAD/DEAH box helicase [Phycisphaerae bacterium]HPU32773.1 DEAD/DEAH box helicase [Phycisphaerae bacterium]